MSSFEWLYGEVDARASREDHAEGPARAALLGGVLTSAAFLTVGLLLALIGRELRPNEPPTTVELVRGIFRFKGVSLLYLGLLILAATPILRVIVMTGVYFRRRERFMFAVSLTVLLLLAIGVLLGAG